MEGRREGVQERRGEERRVIFISFLRHATLTFPSSLFRERQTDRQTAIESTLVKNAVMERLAIVTERDIEREKEARERAMPIHPELSGRKFSARDQATHLGTHLPEAKVCRVLRLLSLPPNL